MMPLWKGWTARQWRNRLVMLTLALTALSIITEFLVEVTLLGSSQLLLIDFLNLFAVSLEGSIPTWYATILLFVAAMILAVIGFIKWRDTDRFRWYWSLLALGFVYLSMDEGAAIHEIFVDPTQQAFNPSGFFAFGWQIVAIPVVIIVGLLFTRFILHLPSRTRLWLIMSGAVYLGGALIVEGISASLWDINDAVTLVYLSVATIEELFEMLGVVFFIYTLLDYMERGGYKFALEQDSPHPAQKSHARRLPIVIPLLVIVNVMLLGWLGSAPQPPIVSEVQSIDVRFNFLVQSDVQADGGVVLETEGIFGIDNPFSRTLGATLLAEYPNVIAVSLPNDNSTTLIATHSSIYSRDDLTELLHSIGETNYIIFETPTVQAISLASQDG